MYVTRRMMALAGLQLQHHQQYHNKHKNNIINIYRINNNNNNNNNSHTSMINCSTNTLTSVRLFSTGSSSGTDPKHKTNNNSNNSHSNNNNNHNNNNCASKNNYNNNNNKIYRFIFPFRSTWRRFRAQRFPHKCLTIIFCTFFCIGSYISLAFILFYQQQSTVAKLFQSSEDYPLEEWAAVEPTLREGDVILFMGTGNMSSKITFAQFILTLLNPAALRYSHVGVVVEPALMERWPSRSLSNLDINNINNNNNLQNSQLQLKQKHSQTRSIADILTAERSMLKRKQKRGVIIMEAVDNLDINAPDINGKVKHECVQLVEANHRLFGRDHNDRWCYNRFAIRRLKGFEWTPQRKRRLRSFINENVGRPLDKSPLIMLSFIHPKLYEWTGARRAGNEISCGELIVELYKWCGVIQRRSRLVPIPANNNNNNNIEGGELIVNHDGSMSHNQFYYNRDSIKTAPVHFAEGMELGVLDFAEGIALGPEVRMSLPGGEL